VYLPDDGFLKAETCSKALLEITKILINCCVVTVFNKAICIVNTTGCIHWKSWSSLSCLRDCRQGLMKGMETQSGTSVSHPIIELNMYCMKVRNITDSANEVPCPTACTEPSLLQAMSFHSQNFKRTNVLVVTSATQPVFIWEKQIIWDLECLEARRIVVQFFKSVD
jgi:hypothetical protein